MIFALTKGVLMIVTALFSAIVAAASQAAPPAESVQPVSIVAKQHDGMEAVDVTGKAPAGSLVTVVESAKMSVDLPIVVLRRVEAIASSSGDFVMQIPIAPVFTRGAELRFTASAPGAQPAAVRFIIGRPTSEPIVNSMDDLNVQ